MQGKKIVIPNEAQQSLDCYTRGKVLSPDSRYLVYDPLPALKLYDFATKETATLMTFFDTTEGLHCVWHENNALLACLAVNQTGYEGRTKIFVLTIIDGKLTDKKTFPQTPSTTADYTVGANTSPGDLRFLNDHMLEYGAHPEFVAEDTVFTVAW